MRAFQLIRHATEGAGTFILHDQPEPLPGPDEVVVKVMACGFNHLDLWLEKNALPVPVSLPRTPGCEIAGTVSRCGTEVKDWAAGARVAIQSNIFCGTCEFCLQGEQSRCLRGELLGVQRDGGFADEVVVPSRVLVPLPEQVSFRSAAALILAGSTAMHMLTHRATITPGSWVLVIAGASGVGTAAIQIAKALGARVLSTGSTAAKRQLAVELGAEQALDYMDSNWPAAVRQITGKRGVDLVVEHVGGSVLVQVFQCLARGGTVVTCGATAGRELKLDLWPFFVKEQRLIGSYGRNRPDLEQTLQWAAQGKLRPVIDTVFPLRDAAEGFDRLRSRQALGKVLVEPD